MDNSRGLLFDADVDKIYLVEVTNTAAYLQNRIGASAINEKLFLRCGQVQSLTSVI